MAGKLSRSERQKAKIRERHLSRIRKQISRMEKRGYVFSDDFYESIKQKSNRALAQIKAKYLYKHARYVDVETGEILPSETGRQIEKRAAVEKAKETIRKKKEKKWKKYKPIDISTGGHDTSEEYPDFNDIILDNFETDFYQWLNADTERYIRYTDERGKQRTGKRSDDVFQAELSAKNILRSLYQQMKAADPEALAKRIDEHAAELSDYLQKIQAIQYSVGEIQTAIDDIAEIIKGSPLELSERIEAEMMAELYGSEETY